MSKELTALEALKQMSAYHLEMGVAIKDLPNYEIIETALRRLERIEKIERTSVLVDEFKSKRTYIAIYGCQAEIGGERLFIIKSHDLKTGIDYIRFGNRTQARSIINTYRKEKRFELL